MNRIETIKGSVKEADKMRDEVGELSELDELYLADIQFLLSRLEIAEKALETTYDYIKQTDQELTKQHILKALKQIRE